MLYLLLIFDSFKYLEYIMRFLSLFLVLLLLYENACCKETAYEGHKRKKASNFTSEDINMLLLVNVTQTFTPGTVLGVVVASIVVVIGSFLVMWRLCCEVEMVVSREVMEPLNSISQKVATSPKTAPAKTVSREKLLHQNSPSVLEIA